MWRKNGSILIILLLFLYVSFIIYCNRGIYFQRFDQKYWKDKYEHSQWKLPFSPRILGDDGLYLYEGYRLIGGGDPTQTNAEIPPLGKYAIGITTIMLGNGSWFGFIVLVLVAASVFTFTKKLTGQTHVASLVTLMVVTDPLMTSQFTLTMLDGIQVLFAILVFIIIHANGRAPLLGAAVGLYAAAKTPLYAPILGILALFYLVKRSTSPLFSILMYIGVGVTVYISQYAYYLWTGHTLMDVLAVQKWIIAFYRHSGLSANTGSALTTLFFGKYWNLFTKSWTGAGQFSPVWPPLMILVSLSAVRLYVFRDKTISALTPMLIYGLSLLLLFTFIPFWTRYLVQVLPIFYVIAGVFLWRARATWFVPLSLLLCAGNLTASALILFPTPEATVRQITYEWSHGYFQDIYERLSLNDKRRMSREEFLKKGLFLNDAGQIEYAYTTLEPQRWSRTVKTQTAIVKILYHTRNLGSFLQTSAVPVIKENGQWKIIWKWENYISGLSDFSTLSTTVNQGKRGSIMKGETILAEDAVSYDVRITASLVNQTQEREQKLLETLSRLYPHIPAKALHQRYVGSGLADREISLGTPTTAISDLRWEEIRGVPGVRLVPTISRVYHREPQDAGLVGEVYNSAFVECCSRLYATTTYDGGSGIEKEYNSTLKGYNGGTLTIVDNDGVTIRTILDVPRRDGQNVTL